MNSLTVRGLVLGSGLPKICVPLAPSNDRDLAFELEALNGVTYDLLEWRLDFLDKGTDFGKLYTMIRKKAPETPLIATFRSLEEGGQRSLSDKDYIRLYRQILDLGADLIDVEWRRGPAVLLSLLKDAHAHGAYVIASNHDFDKTPSREEILRRLLNMQELGADLLKIAVMPQSAQDVLTLLCATEEMNRLYAKRPLITMSMSRLGSFSRICGALTGSCITFGTAARSSAPGQISADGLGQILKFLDFVQ